MYKIAICDDEFEFLQNMHIKIYSELKKRNIETKISDFSDSVSFAEILQKESFDAIFLDIDMPKLSGMDIAGIILKNNVNSNIIFVTSHDMLVYDTFKYRPFGFIRKNYFDTESAEVIDRLIDNFKKNNDSLIFTVSKEIKKIPVNSIIYIESNKNYLNIVMNNKTEKIRATLSSVVSQAGDKLLRCHKGYLVNINYMSKFGSEGIYLSDNILIPIGRMYEKDVKKYILKFLRK